MRHVIAIFILVYLGDSPFQKQSINVIAGMQPQLECSRRRFTEKAGCDIGSEA